MSTDHWLAVIAPGIVTTLTVLVCHVVNARLLRRQLKEAVAHVKDMLEERLPLPKLPEESQIVQVVANPKRRTMWG